jgi:hypothetical protein
LALSYFIVKEIELWIKSEDKGIAVCVCGLNIHIIGIPMVKSVWQIVNHAFPARESSLRCYVLIVQILVSQTVNNK